MLQIQFDRLMLSDINALQGVKGPMLKQMRPAKFKLPVSFVDLETKEELPVPEVMQRANSTKLASLPAKIAKRRARIRSLKTLNVEAKATANGLPEKGSPITSPKQSLAVSPRTSDRGRIKMSLRSSCY